LLLLRAVGAKIASCGYRIVNIDSTIVAQSPKMSPHIREMRGKIARALDMDIDAVSVKATTEEGLGFTGNMEGISATAVALIEKNRLTNI
jgi:2-C-methyl-D-erythritol 2,4-cyclodiphosphate synthase